MIGMTKRWRFFGLAGLMLAGFGTELWISLEGWHSARTAARIVDRRRAEYRRLARSDPVQNPRQRRALEDRLAKAAVELAKCRAIFAPPEMRPRPAPGSGPPQSRTDTFFDVTAFIYQMRKSARDAGVEVGPAEDFGFSRHGPLGSRPQDPLRAGRQRQAASRLLRALWLAGPHRFERLDRTGGRPAAGAAPSDRRKNRRRVPGPQPAASPVQGLTIDGFQVEFTGDTAVLREWLNALSAERWPLLVRDVTVEPATAPPKRGRRAAAGEEPLALVVRPSRSRFVITLESCLLAADSGSKDMEPQRQAVPWPAPPTSAGRKGRSYALFTPPSIYLDRRSGRLIAGTAGEATGPGRDLTLLEVRRGPFRWQLAGHARGADGLYGIFVDTVTGGTAVRRAGTALGDDGWVVTTMEVHHGRADAGEEGKTWVSAVVEANETGERIRVTSRQTCLAGPLRGLFLHRGRRETRRELQEGQSMAVDGVSYCVEQLGLFPPRAVVARVAVGVGRPTMLTLGPQTPVVAREPHARLAAKP